MSTPLRPDFRRRREMGFLRGGRRPLVAPGPMGSWPHRAPMRACTTPVLWPAPRQPGRRRRALPPQGPRHGSAHAAHLVLSPSVWPQVLAQHGSCRHGLSPHGCPDLVGAQPSTSTWSSVSHQACPWSRLCALASGRPRASSRRRVGRRRAARWARSAPAAVLGPPGLEPWGGRPSPWPGRRSGGSSHAWPRIRSVPRTPSRGGQGRRRRRPPTAERPQVAPGRRSPACQSP